LPIHPTLGQDWDTAATAIDWPRLRAFLRTVKRIARIPEDHSSHDHLNEQKPVPLDEAVAARCKAQIAKAQEEVEAASGTRVVWGLVDGFLLYWDQVEHNIFMPAPKHPPLPPSRAHALFSDSELTIGFFDT
jgi:nicotinamide/nicotinate riboside kinase